VESADPVPSLTPEPVRRLEHALCSVGAFGEVRLIVLKGRVRFKMNGAGGDGGWHRACSGEPCAGAERLAPARPWIWQLLGAMSILVGVQLVIGWFIMRVPEELSERENRVAGDLRGNGKGPSANGGTHDS
jgi:hypothetical protein